MDDVIAQDDGDRIVAREGTRQSQGMGDPECAALIPVREIETEVRTVVEQLEHVADGSAANDDHRLAYPHVGKRGKGVEDHRPIVNREQVLVGD